DGAHIVFGSDRDGPWRVFSIPADGSTLEPLVVDMGGDALVRGVATRSPTTWLPDGRLVFTDNANIGSNANVVAAPATSGGKAEPIVQTQYSEEDARVSPDGRLLAYTSDRSGRGEVWVQPLGGGAPARVSSNGGARPVWTRDGRELFYRE